MAIPLSTFLLLWPLYPLHHRIRLAKEARLQELDQLIKAQGDCSREDVLNLETLLAHRSRMRALGTWLLSSHLISRIGFYFIIPPLAWVRAALVERFVDAWIGG